MPYIYNDEDNVPMTSDAWDRNGYNPTVYKSYYDMFPGEEGLPFSDPEPEDGCWNCTCYNGDCCTKDWNNADEIYYVPDRDDHDPDYMCEDWEQNENARREDYRG